MRREEILPLPCGDTYVRWDGPEDGPTMLLLHGATVPSWDFDKIVPELEAAKYRTLRIDFCGHGMSDYKESYKPYSLDLLVGQVLDALCSLGLSNDATMVGLGHSMGAAVLAGVASKGPLQFTDVILVAPMLDYVSLNPYTKLLQVPLIGEILVACYVVRCCENDDGNATELWGITSSERCSMSKR